MEIVIVDSNSPENEEEIVKEFQQRYDKVDQAIKLLSSVSSMPSARQNLELIRENMKSHKKQLAPVHFIFKQVAHDVVARARTSFGLRLDEDGNLTKTEPHEQLFWDVYRGPNGVPVSEEERARIVARKPRMALPDRETVEILR